MSEADKKMVSTSRLLDEIGQSTAAARPRRSAAPGAGGSGRRGSNLLLSVLLLPLLIAVVWLALSQRQLQERVSLLDQENAQLLQAVEHNDARMEVLGEEIARQIQQRFNDLGASAELDDELLSRLQSQVTRDVEQLSGMVAGLQRQVASGQGRDIQLRYTEVDFLLRLAQRRLIHEGDVASARQMFAEADGLLAEIDSTLGNRLRSLLQRDMASLTQVMPVDIDVLAGQLVALTDQIDGLSVLESRVSGHEAAIARAAQGVSAAEEDVAAATLALLRSIFVWRRPGEDQLPALPPQEEMVLRQNLRLFLEQARLALILRDDALLQASLQRATDWLETHFHTEAPAVAAMLAELQALADSSLRPALPDISESLALARQLSGVAGN